MLDRKVHAGVLSGYITNLLPVGSKISYFNSTMSLCLGVVLGWIFYYSPSSYECTITDASFSNSREYVNDYCYNQVEKYNLQIIVVFIGFLDYGIIQVFEYNLTQNLLSGSQVKMLIKKHKLALNSEKVSVASHYKKPFILDSMTGTHKKNIEKILCVDLSSAAVSIVVLSLSTYYIIRLNGYDLSYSQPHSCTFTLPTIVEHKLPIMCYSAFSRFAAIISAVAIFTRVALVLVTCLWSIERARRMANTTNVEHVVFRVHAYCDRFDSLFQENEIVDLRASLTSVMKNAVVQSKMVRNKERVETLLNARNDYAKFKQSNIFLIKDL